MTNSRSLATAGLVLAVSSVSPQHRAHSEGLFWKATSPTATLYLVGSIRLGPDASTFQYPAPMEAAFQRSKSLVVQFDVGADDPELDAFLDQNGAYPDDDSVYRHIGSVYADKLRTFAKAHGLSVDNVGELRPWVVMMLTGGWPMISAANQLAVGMEDHFLREASAAKKPVRAIETATSQARLLAAVPEETQLRLLRQSLDLPEPPDEAQKCEAAWRRADSRTVQIRALSFLPRYPELMSKFVDERTRTVARIAEECLTGTEATFMVVDAGHLLGRNGVINLLRGEGFQVTAERS